jgi:hypothetical protein
VPVALLTSNSVCASMGSIRPVCIGVRREQIGTSPDGP